MNPQPTLLEDQKPRIRRLKVRVRRTPGQRFQNRVELVLRAFGAGSRIVAKEGRKDDRR